MTAFRQVKNFIFDLDGTIADTLPDLTSSMNSMLTHFGLENVSPDKVRANLGRGSLNVIRAVLPAERAADETFLKEAHRYYYNEYLNNYLNETKPYPCALEGLELMKKKGAKIAVLSNKDTAMVKGICEKLFPSGLFDAVYGFDGRYSHKPDPSSSLAIAAEFGAPACEFAFVGDSEVDMQTAGNAGMQKVGVNWGFRNVPLLLDNGAIKILYSSKDFEEMVL